jgi:hypothetical protein
MKLRFAAIAVASLALAGCSDAGFSFDDILGFPDAGATAPVARPAQTVSASITAQQGSATLATAQSQPPSAFCRGVATQDAVQGAFDGPTQARVAQRSYAQCVAQFGAN